MSIIISSQVLLLFALWWIGVCIAPLYWSLNVRRSTYYFARWTHLLDRLVFSSETCVDYPDLPCSLQKKITMYYFWFRFTLIYHISLIIMMIYIWHRTIRLFSCFLLLFNITLIIYGTNLIFHIYRLDFILVMCTGQLIMVYSAMECRMPHKLEDPLSTLCGKCYPLNSRYERLQNDTSINARFYRWMKKMKKKWNIQEEKLVVTIIVTIIMFVFFSILCCYLPSPFSININDM